MAKVKVPYATLVGLLGKAPKDPAVLAMIAKAGKVSVKSDFIIAKEAGFDFAIDYPEVKGPKPKKVLAAMWLFAEGVDKHAEYTDLPEGFAFVPRAELLAKLPPPIDTFKIGKGSVPVETKDVTRDTWLVGAHEISAGYRGGVCTDLNVCLSEAAQGGRDLSTHPLHFEVKPTDAPADAELVGMALLVAWAADRFGLPDKHAKTELGRQLAARAITPRAFLVKACDKTLTSLDVAGELGDFLYGYVHRTFLDDEGDRDAADKAITKLLRLKRSDERAYTDDFLGTFSKVLESPFHVPDSWDAVDRIAPVLDARYADYKATRFAKAPKLALYDKAAAARDKVSIAPDRKAKGAASADAALAADLIAAIGKPLKDAAVKAVITRAGMPVGKRIDQQANPALGVSYMGSKIGKELCVTGVWFYAAKQRSYVRGIGAEVQFDAYPGALPSALAFGDARAAVAKKLGKPKSSSDEHDFWSPRRGLKQSCCFAKGKLVEVHYFRPDDD